MLDLSLPLNPIYLDIPSGKHSQFAIENGPVEIVDLSTKNGDCP